MFSDVGNGFLLSLTCDPFHNESVKICLFIDFFNDVFGLFIVLCPVKPFLQLKHSYHLPPFRLFVQ